MNSLTDNNPTIREDRLEHILSGEVQSLTVSELRKQLQSLPDGVILTISIEPGGTDYGKA